MTIEAAVSERKKERLSGKYAVLDIPTLTRFWIMARHIIGSLVVGWRLEPMVVFQTPLTKSATIFSPLRQGLDTFEQVVWQKSKSSTTLYLAP